MGDRLVLYLTLSTAVAALAPGGVLAQAPRFEVVPRLAIHAPTREIGPAAPAVGVRYLHLDRVVAAAAFEVEAGARWPGSRITTRLVGLATLPSDVSGHFACYPGRACPDILLSASAEASMRAAVVDVLYSPLGDGGAVKPFALLGTGIRKYRFRWPESPATAAGDYTDAGPVVHAGLGVEIVVAGQSLRAEVADWWSGRGPELADGSGFGGAGEPRRHSQHDIVASLGWRLLRF